MLHTFREIRVSLNIGTESLETLTNRKQEYEFEHFCRKLAEKEICPNLRVQARRRFTSAGFWRLLDAQAKAMSDNDAAQRLNNARAMLFKTTFNRSKQPPKHTQNRPAQTLLRNTS
jgi:hypothetical protein